MAVERKRYWLRHLILIIVLAIVLFPMLWLVTTSLRRDQAAFSSKLFSSRLTLQHYRNLIFPERSVPRLVLDMQSAVYRTGEYREKSEESIIKSVTGFLAKLDSLLEESSGISRTVSTGFDNVWAAMKTEGQSEMIAEMERLRIIDLEKFSETMRGLDVSPESSGYRAALATVLPSHPLLSDGYMFYLEQLGERAETVREYAEAYKESVSFVLNQRDVLVNLLEESDFPDKEQTLELLGTAEEFITADSIDYSSWRRREERRLDRNIAALEDVVEAGQFDLINAEWEAFSDTFVSASEIWESLQQASRQLIEELEQEQIAFLGEAPQLYQSALETIQESEHSITQLESEIATIRSAITELRLVLDMISPVVVPEAEKLRALQASVNRALQKPPVEQPAPGTMLALMEELSRASENLRVSLLQLKTAEFDDKEVVSHLEELSSYLTWYEERSQELLSRHLDPDIRRAFEIIRVSITGIRRVMPGLLDASEQFASMKETLNEKTSVLEDERNEIQDAEALLVSLKEDAEKRTGELSLYERYARLDLASFRASESIHSRETAQLYYDRVGPIAAPLFDQRASRRYRAITWFNDFERAYADAQEGTLVLNQMIDDISTMKEELEAKIFDYIHLRAMGASFTLEDFEEIINVYNRAFPTFNARYQRASRLLSELLESPTSYSTELSRDLRRLDSALFRANQVWAQKEMTYFYFMRWLLNSIIVALTVALIMVAASAFAAYPFSRMRFFGRKQGLLALLLIQMFPSVMFMIALYALLQFLGRYIPMLGLDTLGGLILVYSGGIAFNIWLIKGYFDTIPDTLEEAALIDGATRFQTFYKIVIPLARPILAVIAILTFMSIFNEFVLAKIMLQSINRWTYAVGLWQFSGRFETAWGPFTAAALVGAVPMLLFFLILQDYIVGGLTKGAVKG